MVAPDGVANRLTSTFNAQDPGNQDRFAMIEVGARMVADHPLTGVGPNMVPRVYEQYRPDYAVNATNPHLHNVPLQIAAERGLPALAVWLWFVVAVTLALFRMFRHRARGQRVRCSRRRRSPRWPACWPPDSSNTTSAIPSS